MIKEVSLFKILVHFYQITWNHIPDNSILHDWSLPENLNIKYFALFNYSVSNVII